MLLSKCVIVKMQNLSKQQEASGLLSSFRIKSPLSKIILVVSLLIVLSKFDYTGPGIQFNYK